MLQRSNRRKRGYRIITPPAKRRKSIQNDELGRKNGRANRELERPKHEKAFKFRPCSARSTPEAKRTPPLTSAPHGGIQLNRWFSALTTKRISPSGANKGTACMPLGRRNLQAAVREAQKYSRCTKTQSIANYSLLNFPFQTDAGVLFAVQLVPDVSQIRQEAGCSVLRNRR